MNAWAWVLVACASYFALVFGMEVGSELAHRRYAKHHPKPQRPLCHFCSLYPAQPNSLHCSNMCADADLGLLGVNQ